MTRSARSSRPVWTLVGILIAAMSVVACSRTIPSSSAVADTSPPSVEDSSAADLTPVPGDSTSSAVEPGETPTQTDTDWGRIWDAVPDSFPRPAASVPADSISGPASAAYSIGAGAEEATATVKAGLDAAGYTTDQSGPLEDGSFVLDSTGPAEGCKVQTTLTPLSGTTLMTVLFGADCPFE